MKITTASDLDGSRLRDNNPGRAEMGKGNPWPKTMHDELKLPNGKTVGETSNEELRTALHALGIEGAHSGGRDLIVQRLADRIANFRQRAGDEAVAAWLQANK